MAALGDHAGALRIYGDLAAETTNPPEIRTQALNNMALLWREMGNLPRAIELMREDVNLCQQAGDSYGQFVAHVNLSQTLALAAREDDAKQHADTAVTVGKRYKQTPAYKIAERLSSKR